MRGWGVAVAFVVVASAASAAGLVPAAPGVNSAPWGVWTPQHVDASPDYVTGLSAGPRLAVDAHGAPHILYGAIPANLTPHTIFYAYHDGVSWQKVRVQANGGFPGGLAFDDEGILHIVYYSSEGGSYTLKHGVWDGSSFQISDIAPNVPFGESDLGFDDFGKMHVYFTSGLLVRYAHQVNGAWVFETADDQALGDFTVSSFAVAADGSVHFAHGDSAPGETIRYARRSPAGQWSVETVAGCMWFVGIAVDAQSRPHVSCQSPSQGLVYLHHDGTQWVKEVLDDGAWWKPANYRGRDSDIAVDSKGQPHIAYRDRLLTSNTNHPLYAVHLKYATKTASGWIYETADAVGTATGFVPDVEIDAHDRPRIAYVHTWISQSVPSGLPGRYDLKYAEPASVVLSAVGE